MGLIHDDVGLSLTYAEFHASTLHVLEAQAQGDIVIADSTTALKRLAAGAAGYFLRTGGAGADPAWAAPDAGELTYTPSVLTDWDGDADPGGVDDALDQLAERVDDLEAYDLNGTELILDEDGDTSITADADDRIDFKVGTVDRFKMDNSGHFSSFGYLYPGTSAAMQAARYLGDDGTNLELNAGAGDLEVATTGSEKGIKVTGTNDGNRGPELHLYHLSASPAADDHVGTIVFKGEDAASNLTNYGYQFVQITDPTNESEDAEYYWNLITGGSDVSAMQLSGTYFGTRGFVYPGTGSALQTSRYIKDDGTNLYATSGLRVVRVDDGAEGAYLYLDHDSASPAAWDLMGHLVFRAKDSEANWTTYGDVVVRIVDPTDVSEDAEMRIYLMEAGASNHVLTLTQAGELSLDVLPVVEHDVGWHGLDDVEILRAVRRGEKDRQPFRDLGIYKVKEDGSGSGDAMNLQAAIGFGFETMMFLRTKQEAIEDQIATMASLISSLQAQVEMLGGSV